MKLHTMLALYTVTYIIVEFGDREKAKIFFIRVPLATVT